MIFRKLRHINLDAYNAQDMFIDTYRFDFNTSFICNYLSKEVRKLNIAGDGTYKMISVRINNNLSGCRLTYGSDNPDVLSVLLPVSEQEQRWYNNTTDIVERSEFYLGLLEKGYTLASDFKTIPINSLLQLHDKFRENNYKNEWVWNKKLIRDYGIYIIFKCHYTTFDFRLEMEVYDTKQTVLLTKGIVLQTGPDELFFDKEFRKIDVFDRKLIITDFLNQKNFEFDLHQLSEGVFNVKKRVDEIVHFPPINHIELIERITW